MEFSNVVSFMCGEGNWILEFDYLFVVENVWIEMCDYIY